ncbi:MFS transporter [Aspergillus puulaauensis]|uniref:Major facilitator superfamily (MFS) profile domain-containing protein n=1 Tax=Aspergillus puulaauensis TaxID=1220207 RepID=A0A7R7XSI1_9EURO|nr:uncharacterized protein APUU_60003A [Aspergillus puulaauensis]BCS26955.1 hypothetical protein APUU_60003A [Aspergillus puulaauensis]
MTSNEEPLGYRWRSSKSFVIACICIALFTESFLFSFMVPILHHMFVERLHVDPLRIQFYTSATLALHGLTGMISSPIIGHFCDKHRNRRIQLLISLVGCLVATIMVAGSRSLWVFFLGRVVQGLLGSAVWVIGMATVADRFEKDHMGRVMSIIMAFVSTGNVAGPAISGVLFENVGYWPTWCAPFAVLVIDTIARLVMLDEMDELRAFSSQSSSVGSPSIAENINDARPLLSSAADSKQGRLNNSKVSFYRDMLSNKRVLTCLLIGVVSGSILTSLPTTLPLHVQEVFQWGTDKIGLLFLCQEISMIILGPLSGWLRDRVGLRYPATGSMALLSPLVFFLGVPGRNQHFPWASADSASGPAIYIASLAGIGAVSPFLRGVAALELTVIIKERQAEDPYVFGPNGGISRAYSMSAIASTLPRMVGPIISGYLHVTVGYFYMNLIYAFIAILLSVSAFCFLSDKKRSRPTSSDASA